MNLFSKISSFTRDFLFALHNNTIIWACKSVGKPGYGDVLIFDVIPKRYRSQTVFSIVGISDTVGNDGVWQTKITCIMRPKVDMTEYKQYSV